MLKGKTKSGIKFSVDLEGLKKIEWKLTKLMMKMYSENEQEQMNAILNLIDLVLGGQKGVDTFEEEIAKAHEGSLTNEIVIAEYKDLLESVGKALKN